ncbi:hypothetical protein D6C78_10876 [Aureobasidium pullulans]|uniref:Uncharacterized protein n=1 Tax=Aureobasidium pullulans TaxID=5580 RepID=A0A4T0B955_AURPU|nr:hypothetical protein D6C78_10876 [Aureobasidium pullulans]
MNLTFEENTFHCKLSSAVRLATSQKVFVYLVLDASQVQDIVVCDVNHIAPPDIVNTFVKQGCCTTQADIMSIRFTLKAHAPLVTPTLALEKRPSSRSAIDALLRLGRCETFEVHVPTGSMKQERLSDLCTALASRALKPSPTEVLKGLYAGSGIKTITHVDELWPSDTLDRPPAYDEATVAGASTHESSVPSNTRFWRSPTARGKRQISPEPCTNDQRIKEKLDVECSGLEHAVTELESRLDDLENDLKDNLRNDLSLELLIKLEDFIEFRLEDVEEVVKNDLRIATENATYNFKMELNWPE